MSFLIAALPMYDWPETRAETDTQWAAIRDRLRAAGIAAPEALTRVAGDLSALWRDPALLLAQTCWGPMGLGLADHVEVVGQPDYSGYEGGRGELYSSAVVMRRADIPPSGLPAISPSRREMAGRPEGGVEAPSDGRAVLPLDLLGGRRFAFNGRDSMSGYLALEQDLAALGESLALFCGRVETGGHRASVVAVAQGRADVAAVDCRSWTLAQRFEPAAKKLAVVGWTARRKGLPFITAKATPPAVVAKLKVVLEMS